ncbi:MULTISPECIES: LytTR family DNA-binding domain-containing protein [unclassified Duganella]|uniref:LytR/AlgR family response regulator transcription factor n=1 Tax=unclassified Duganella TaxID=2636909 RepID=UPI0006F6FA4F|nr:MULTISPECIES: LytTR family DNA-binding domain-containing protein [unclassified Duganella]KQV45448.1 two-component system response regulator [Duganella sp. Root336D2]KRC00709.1 two-component system response regulator [Duganella sp. Root198D2]
MKPRILIADDEPLLRAELRELLAALWPEAELLPDAADGFEALRLARELAPDVAFLDIRMPGLDGLQLAATFGSRTHVVFVTAYNEHALAAFEQGAHDYLLKPVDAARLARTVGRLRERVLLPPPDLRRITADVRAASALSATAGTQAPSWIQASVGQAVHFIDLSDILYFVAEDKYTRVVAQGLEAHIRTPLKELAGTLEGAGFWQVHRSYVVAVKRIAAAVRDGDNAMWLTLRGHGARLPVSQRFQHRFKGM